MEKICYKYFKEAEKLCEWLNENQGNFTKHNVKILSSSIHVVGDSTVNGFYVFYWQREKEYLKGIRKKKYLHTEKV